MPRHSNSTTAPTNLPPLPLPLPRTTDLLRKNAHLPSSSFSSSSSSLSSSSPPLFPGSASSMHPKPRTRRNSTRSSTTAAAPLPSQLQFPAKSLVNKVKAVRARRQWSAEEDALVLRGLKLHAQAKNKWILVAKMVPTRTRLQVKSRARRLMPDVYGDMRQRRPSASSFSSSSSSSSASLSDVESASQDDEAVAAEHELSSADDRSEAEDESSTLSVGEQTIPSPQTLSTVALLSSSPPPAAHGTRPRRVSSSRQATTAKDLPPLPTSPPILSPTWRSPPSALPPLPTFLPPLSPPPLPLPTARRPSIPIKRSRQSSPPASPHSSLSSAPPSPDVDPPISSKQAKPNLLDPFTLLRPLTPPTPPYTLHISPLPLALMDMHAHLLQSEVIGLLGGTYNPASRSLHIQAMYPCDSPSLASSIQCEMDPVAETRARAAFAQDGLAVVGWYHSHPTFDAWPSVRDVENQGVYQRLFTRQGEGEGNEVEPFVGAIVTPYHAHRATLVSDIAFYCVGGEAYDVPYRVEEVRDKVDARLEALTHSVLDVFDGFCQHHRKEVQHLSKIKYHGWTRFAKLKHSVRSQSGLDLDPLIDSFLAKVLGPKVVVDQVQPAVTEDADDEGDVDV